jgi:hypothetical protein
MPRNETSGPIGVPLADEISRSVGNDCRLGRIIDQWCELVREVHLSCRTKSCGDARSSAPHAILDLLHCFVAECPKRTADNSRLRGKATSSHTAQCFYPADSSRAPQGGAITTRCKDAVL